MQNVLDKIPCASRNPILLDAKVLEQDITVTILDQELVPDTGVAALGKNYDTNTSNLCTNNGPPGRTSSAGTNTCRGT